MSSTKWSKCHGTVFYKLGSTLLRSFDNQFDMRFYVQRATRRFSAEDDGGYSLEVGIRSRKQMEVTA